MINLKKTFLTCLLLIWCSVATAPRSLQDECQREPVGTTSARSAGDNGFRVRLEGQRRRPDTYTPGQVYTVSINGTLAKQKLMGFMLVAVPEHAVDETTSLGTFQHFSDRLTQSSSSCPHVITHTDLRPKAGVEVMWTAPPSGSGCIEFRATVLEYGHIWYKDEGALTKKVCENSGTSESRTSQEMTPDCCACGQGKYQVTFYGLWSRQTHPTAWPENQRLIHWSNIVGASHSKAYVPWQYGEHASSGVKQVCEYGTSNKLEIEMRKESGNVRTVIKTPGIWWNPTEALTQSRSARFSVDRKNHLLSLLTMLGPSPDWCVGLSALDLCLPNCSWSSDFTIDLYPWDAGTDDGIQFESPNKPADPPHRIKKLTNRDPDNPSSPFYGKKMYAPFARVEIRRLNVKPGVATVCTGNETDIDDEETNHFDPRENFEDMAAGGMSSKDMIMKKLAMLSNAEETMTDDEIMMKKKLMMMLQNLETETKCSLTDWSDWSKCSVTCGMGERVRKRSYNNPMMNEAMCGKPIMETVKCATAQQLCEDINSDCAVTAWSIWAPCSVTCGKGITQRLRYYLHPERTGGNCDRSMSERTLCVADIPDCAKAEMMKNYTEICSLPKDDGHCNGIFNRWYFNMKSMMCEKFVYSGCRGNNNQFHSYEKCTQKCLERMSKVVQKKPPKKKKVPTATLR